MLARPLGKDPRRGIEPDLSSMRKYFCTFPPNLISEPIVSHTLGEKFGVIPNIRAASITDSTALVAVEIEGEDEAIALSVEYMRERGVQVEEIKEDSV